MKLDYGTLLSFEPFSLPYGFGIISPTLKEISKLQFNTYYAYLSVIDLSVDKYYSQIDNDEIDYFGQYTDEEKELVLKIRAEYDDLSSMEKNKIKPVIIFSYDKKLIGTISDALSFFTDKKFEYSQDYNAFLHKNGDDIISAIDIKIYGDVVNLIYQRNGINKPEKEKAPVFKNKTAEKWYYRTKKAEEKIKTKSSKNLELPNIISAVAAKHNSLNIINIWNITIYQLYDQFQRLQNNCMYDIQSLSVAVWGNEKNKFDSALWYKNITL